MSGMVLGLIFVGVFGAGVLVGGTFGYLHRKDVTKIVTAAKQEYKNKLDDIASEVKSWRTK